MWLIELCTAAESNKNDSQYFRQNVPFGGGLYFIVVFFWSDFH